MTDTTTQAVTALLDGVTPGPWDWQVSRVSRSVELSGGRQSKAGGDLTVMSFARWGTQQAAPVFYTWEGNYAAKVDRADKIAVPEYGREHHAEWFARIDHPDARFIAAARDLVPALLAERDALAAQLAAAESRVFEPCEPGGFVGDIYYGHPVKTTMGTHRWDGKEWHKLPSEIEALMSLLAESREQLAAAEARARESALDALAAYGQASDAHTAQLAAEAKLATALEALADLVSWFDGGPSSYGPWIIASGDHGADDAVAVARALAKGGAT